MSPYGWKSVFSSFEKMKVLVVGDAMIDAYMWGTINRESPEAPIPIVDIEKHEKRLGGAANVAINIKALGATPVLCSVIGNDDLGFVQLMKSENLSCQGLSFEDRKTTVKTRIISEGKHRLRVDEEDRFPISSEKNFIDKVSSLIKDVDVVIFQDYNKGVLTKNVIQKIIDLAKSHSIPTLADPKIENYFSFKGVDLFKPNFNELCHSANEKIINTDIKKIETTVSHHKKALEANYFMLTLSEKGIYFSSDKSNKWFPAYDRNIVDVSGAGDCVIATAALALASKLPSEYISQLSNLAGGLACEKVGVNPIEKSQFLNEASRLIPIHKTYSE